MQLKDLKTSCEASKSVNMQDCHVLKNMTKPRLLDVKALSESVRKLGAAKASTRMGLGGQRRPVVEDYVRVVDGKADKSSSPTQRCMWQDATLF